MINTNNEIQKLKDIKDRLRSEFDKKNKHIEELIEENKKLLIEAENYKVKIEELEKQNEILKTAKTISLTDEDKSTVKDKINKIIREIDQSIGLLNE